jgi:hypothetical protein
MASLFLRSHGREKKTLLTAGWKPEARPGEIPRHRVGAGTRDPESANTAPLKAHC